MKITSYLFAALALSMALLEPLAAQDPPPAALADPPPSALAEVEGARSRMCVPALAKIAAVDEALAPLFRKGERIQALNAALTVEDSMLVAPFDSGDPIEVAVRQWFAADNALALQYLASSDESIQERRTEAREAMRQRLRDAMEPMVVEADSIIAEAGDFESAAEACEGAIFVRSAVLEACQTDPSPICEPARAAAPGSGFAFVDAAEDLWDVEEMRAWTEPVPLQPTADGGLGGARTAALTRKGNLLFSLGVEPLVRSRASVTPEEAAIFDAALDSMGIVFEDNRYVMTPALTLNFNVPATMGGETHYLLHFGDLSKPAEDVIWTAPTPGGVPISTTFPAPPWALAGLAAGEAVSLTAVRLGADGGEAEAVFTLEITPLGQARSVSTLLSYIVSGQFGKDLLRLVPPAPAGPGGGD